MAWLWRILQLLIELFRVCLHPPLNTLPKLHMHILVRVIWRYNTCLVRAVRERRYLSLRRQFISLRAVLQMLYMCWDHLAIAAKVTPKMFMEVNRKDHWITETQIKTIEIFTGAYQFCFVRIKFDITFLKYLCIYSSSICPALSTCRNYFIKQRRV